MKAPLLRCTVVMSVSPSAAADQINASVALGASEEETEAAGDDSGREKQSVVVPPCRGRGWETTRTRAKLPLVAGSLQSRPL